ncbi:MAG: PaaI family thioesterase [Ilumatobacter sp.]
MSDSPQQDPSSPARTATDGVPAFDDATTTAPFPLQSFLGMQLSGTAPGSGTAQLTLGAAHANPNGVAHGAVLFALVDTAMGKATMSVIDDGLYCASVELSLRFIRPAAEGQLTAEATVVKRGRSIVHLDARVHDGDDRLIATSSGTFAILGG